MIGALGQVKLLDYPIATSADQSVPQVVQIGACISGPVGQVGRKLRMPLLSPFRNLDNSRRTRGDIRVEECQPHQSDCRSVMVALEEQPTCT